jgi:hypothetical protein
LAKSQIAAGDAISVIRAMAQGDLAATFELGFVSADTSLWHFLELSASSGSGIRHLPRCLSYPDGASLCVLRVNALLLNAKENKLAA